MKRLKLAVLLPAALAALAWMGPAASQTPAASEAGALQQDGMLNRLIQQTGVYNRSKTGKTPDFVTDPTWPALLPHNWLLGQIGGLYVDSHDHVWVYNRPRTMSNDEAGLEKAVPGAKDDKGQPVNGLGFVRANGFGGDCCKAAPSVLEFDMAGKLLKAWGGPADPGWLASHCKASAGCIWPNSEHGIYVDSHDNVWIAGNTAAPRPPAPGAAARASRTATPWATNKSGGDGFVLKFDVNGNFKMRIGGTPNGPDSNNKDSGINGTPTLYQPADMVVDPKTNLLYVADGYGNRRVLIVNADTGKYVGHFGAYGNNPVNDADAAAQGLWGDDAPKGHLKPAFFRSPVHCVKIASDGKIYVCDRGNDRIQVFDGKDPNLGKPCSNPTGVAGKCGFVAERFISGKSYTLPLLPGTAVSMNFSPDAAQSCLYIGDNTNQTVYILNRSNLQELGRVGHAGRMVGDLNWLHQVAIDSKGDLYTAEVSEGKRIQKFVRYGAESCSGTGSSVVGGPMP